MPKIKKLPLSELLIAKGFATNEKVAVSLIIQGKVSVEGRVCKGARERFSEDADVEVVDASSPYLSRGGLKLANFLDSLGVLSPKISDAVCLDIGSGTGGFTQVLLERNARKVYAVDVGVGVIAPALRNDKRIVLLEGFNAKFLTTEEIPEEIQLVTIDVSFISGVSLLKVVRNLRLARADSIECKVILLAKPQFERENNPEDVRRGEFVKGVIKSKALMLRTLMRIYEKITSFCFTPLRIALAEPRGTKGNFEFFLLLREARQDDFGDDSLGDSLLNGSGGRKGKGRHVTSDMNVSLDKATFYGIAQDIINSLPLV